MNREELRKRWNDNLEKFLNEDVYSMSALPRSEQLVRLDGLFRDAFRYNAETNRGKPHTVQQSIQIDRLLDLYSDGDSIDIEVDNAYPYHQAFLDDIRYGKYPKYRDETNDEQVEKLDVSDSNPDEYDPLDQEYDAGF